MNYDHTDHNKYETAALVLGFAGFILMLAGCCCNMYILMLSVVADVAAIVVSIISRQTTGGHFTRTTKQAMTLAVWALIFSFGFALLYSSVINNEELMAQIEALYESMGYDFTLP